MTFEAGTELDHYRLIEPIGEGGMGVVWKARDTSLDRDVAIKVLPDHFAGDHAFLARFEREAKAVAALSHPNIVGIFGFGKASGRAYAVMELLEGQTLRDVLDTGLLPPRKAVDIARQVAEGLDAAHGKGIIHRDLKPESVLVTSNGRARILDFGLATPLPGTGPGDETWLHAEQLTTPGTVMGTVGYMSPEQVRAEPAGSRSDVFASMRDGVSDIWRRPADLSTPVERVLESGGATLPDSASSDGQWLCFSRMSRRNSDIARISLVGEPDVEVPLDSRADELDGRVSPDGKFFGFRSDETGRWDIHVMEIASKRRSIISSVEGHFPIRTRDGNRIL
jgi:serine/threonine protein kinase